MTTKIFIDVTEMRIIYGYLNHDPQISIVIDVCDQDISEVADLCIDSQNVALNEANTKAFGDLLSNGKIRIYKRGGAFILPSTNAVNCIRLEPIYFVKDLKKTYK